MMHRFFWAFILLLVQLAPAQVQAGTQRVFVLHSYDASHVCGQPQHAGVVRALRDSGIDQRQLIIDSWAMDTKTTYTTPAQIESQAQIALEKINAFNPDVLVTLDDNAFRTVALKLLDTDLPIVFSGMNNLPERYNAQGLWLESRQKPGHNITGVYEKIHFVSALRVQRQIQPQLKKIQVFSDYSPTGKALVRQIRQELKSTALPGIEVEFFISDSWEAYQSAVTAADHSDADALYPVALRLTDRQGKTRVASEILSWTARNSNKPSIPLNFAFVKLGLFGGAGVDFDAMGYQAGKQVVKILQGASAGDLPVEDAERFALVFHTARAEQLGISIPDSILLAADVVYKDGL